MTEFEVSENRKFNEYVLQQIKKKCVEVGSSVPRIERALNYGSASVFAWGKAKRKAPMDRIEAIAEYLGCPVGQLLPPKDEKAAAPEDDGDLQEVVRLLRTASPEVRAAVVQLLKAAAHPAAAPGAQSEQL